MEELQIEGIFYLAVCLVAISLPICGIFLACITNRRKTLIETLKLGYCVMAGIIFLWSIMSSNWIEAENVLLMSQGPNKLPILTKVGFHSGLWGLHLFVKYPVPYHEDIYVSYYVDLSSKNRLHEEHLHCLKMGYDKSLSTITSHLGGESRTWNGDLGSRIQNILRIITTCVLGASYIWLLWACALSFNVVKHVITTIFITFGIIIEVSSFTLFMLVRYLPDVRLSDGQLLSISLGHTWIVASVLGFILTSSGICILYCTPRKATSTHILTLKDSRKVDSEDVTSCFCRTFQVKSFQKEEPIFSSNLIKDEEILESFSPPSHYSFLDQNLRKVGPSTMSQMFVQ